MFQFLKQGSENSGAIIFIDEIDAVGTKRFDSELSGDREVQRTMLELLNQLDGFSSEDRIKVSLIFWALRPRFDSPILKPRADSQLALASSRRNFNEFVLIQNVCDGRWLQQQTESTFWTLLSSGQDVWIARSSFPIPLKRRVHASFRSTRVR